MSEILSIERAVKNFGAVQALRGVDLAVVTGQVHAICGDNGAGKSTLIKLIAGVEPIDSGVIRIKGRKVRLRTPHDALNAGVATIHQDLALMPKMAIYQNIFMGSELTRSFLGIRYLDKSAMRRLSLEQMSRLNDSLNDMNKRVEDLSGGQRQAVAICRALLWNADIVIMDEPTASLGVRETQQVLDLLRRLRESGKTVILVSHNMKDVADVADAVTILRNGEVQARITDQRLSADELAHLILSGETQSL